MKSHSSSQIWLVIAPKNWEIMSMTLLSDTSSTPSTPVQLENPISIPTDSNLKKSTLIQ